MLRHGDYATPLIENQSARTGGTLVKGHHIVHVLPPLARFRDSRCFLVSGLESGVFFLPKHGFSFVFIDAEGSSELE
jgi:hypothetical protein